MRLSAAGGLSTPHFRRGRSWSHKPEKHNFFHPGEECKKRLYLHPLRLTHPCDRLVQGEMAEWSIAAVLKTVVRATGPGVRIPLSPQQTIQAVLPQGSTASVFRAATKELALEGKQ